VEPLAHPVLAGHSLYHGKRQGARQRGLKSKNMTAPKGQTEANRALALGAAIRKRRRERRLTLNQLAEQVPMSASNLSRIELGSQGPPPDETIERIAAALQADPQELLRAAGRYASGQSFEEAVLARLDALRRELRRVEGAVGEIKTAISGQKLS
jgi:transcriptional regulator with XRE-family HTH domain